MKKVININFQGRVVPIEESSYELLKQYTDSLRNYFEKEEGRDEIINDIESRIGELFQERLKNGATCITDDDVNTIMNNMGRPKDFAAADDDQAKREDFENEKTGTAGQQAYQAYTGKKLYRDANNKIIGGVCSGIAAYFTIEPIIVRLVFIFSGIGFLAYFILWAFVPSSDNVQNGIRRRLYRNPDNKIIGGVCSGLSSYFNINVWIPRILFLIPFISFFFRWGHYGPFTLPHFVNFSFSPGTFLIYIILWLVLPEANSTSEKLEMKGEKVDLNSIKNSVVEEMKGVQHRMGKFGKEAKEFAQQKSNIAGAEIGHVVRRTRSSLGDIIVFIAKAFGYFIIGCVALALIGALLGLGIVALGLFPLKDYILNDGWQNVYAWGSLLFFIGVPVVGIITFIIRRIAKIKSRNNLMRYSFLALWLLGLFCFISLFVSVGRDFRNTNTITEQNLPLSNPAVNKLEVKNFTTGHYYDRTRWFHFEPFANFGDDDTVFVNNVTIRIVKSANDSFKLTLLKICNGRSRKFADTLANKIAYDIHQNDSLLVIDKGIAITKEDKFRNQHIILTVAVPVGKVVNINRTLKWAQWEHFNGPWNHDDWNIQWNYDWDDDEIKGWEDHYGEDMIMKTDGLYTLDGKPVNGRMERNNGNDNDDDSQDENALPKPGNSNDYRYDQTQQTIDSLQKIKEIQIEKVKDSLQKVKDQIDKKLEKLQKADSTNQKAFFHSGAHKYDFFVSI